MARTKQPAKASKAPTAGKPGKPSKTAPKAAKGKGKGKSGEASPPPEPPVTVPAGEAPIAVETTAEVKIRRETLASEDEPAGDGSPALWALVAEAPQIFRGVKQAALSGYGMVWTPRFVLAQSVFDGAPAAQKKIFTDPRKLREWLLEFDENRETEAVLFAALEEESMKLALSNLKPLPGGLRLSRTSITVHVPDIFDTDASFSQLARLFVGPDGERVWFNDGILDNLGDPTTLVQTATDGPGKRCFVDPSGQFAIFHEKASTTASIETRAAQDLFYREGEPGRETATLPTPLTSAMLGTAPAGAPGKVIVRTTVADDPAPPTPAERTDARGSARAAKGKGSKRR